MTTLWKTPLTKRKIIDCTDEELAEVGLLGEGAHEKIVEMVKSVRQYPEYMSDLNMSSLECVKRSLDRKLRRPPRPPSPPPRSNVIECVDPNDLSIVSPHLISKFERVNYYHGISRDPPALYYRSDHESNPYPVPSPDTPFRLPIKTPQGVFDSAFSEVWDKVARLIIALLKQRSINFSVLLATRFSSRYEGGPETMGPVVIWIGTRPNTTSPEMAREATTDILRILQDHNINESPVEWYHCESTYKRL